MSQSSQSNRCLVLAERPHGAPNERTFRLEEQNIPTPAAGQMLIRSVFISLDPYMRGRISDAKSYAASVEIGQTMVGGAVGRVVSSNLPGFAEGDWVLSMSGWQDYALSDGVGVSNMGQNPSHPSYALGVLGMPGFTGYMGLLDIGQPKAGETVVVASATGPVGATVGQVAKIKGCRAVGIAGGPEKCRFAVEELGFDACIDHYADDFAAQLKAACPAGIDVYFENVGGKVFDAVMPLLNTRARIPLCGLIAQYNATSLPEGPDRLPLLTRTMLTKRLTVRGFIIFDDYGQHYPTFLKEMSAWVAEGKVKYREHLVEGLETAPQAFVDLLEGRNFGKMVVRVGPDSLA